MSKSFVQLPHRFISIIGEDAEKFLQGQCSIDLSSLALNEFSYGTLNTPKGRMYALFKIIRANNGLLLSVDKSVVESTLATLKKYAVFFKCELAICSYSAYGCQTDQETELVSICPELKDSIKQNVSFSVSGDNNTYILNIPGDKGLLELWTDRNMPNACSDTSYQEHWLANEVLEGIPQIYEQTSEQFILQELNLHELGAVSFKKGCYTGQEIIARMKFLGKLKKRMFLLKTSSNSDLALEPGQDVYIKTTADERKKAGKLVRCHRLDSESVVALAVLNKELVDQESSATVGDSAEQTFAITGLEYNTK